MEYKVLPFNASLKRGDSADGVAQQLQQLIDRQLAEGYEYVGLEEITTEIEPDNGCFGIGAKPGFTVSVSVAVFKK